MGKIIPFPVPQVYQQAITESGARTKVLIETLNLSFEKGMLNERTFQYLLEYLHLDLDRDLIPSDRAIVKFHCENYYGISI